MNFEDNALPRISASKQMQAPDAPFAILDIGSNSVRLVAYGGTARNPLPIYNEKSFCRLGESVAETGRIEGSYWDDAMETFARFRAISKRLKVSHLQAVATAAVRDAKNAHAFIEAAEKVLKSKIDVLSGKEEARYSAQGVLMGFYRVDGLIADLGGGSLDLARVKKGEIKQLVSLPLGGLALDIACQNDRNAVREKVRSALAELDWLEKNKDKPLYLVGGSWRALASVYMDSVNCDLKVLHHFKLSPEKISLFLSQMACLQPKQTEVLIAASNNRRSSIPNASIILQELLEFTHSDMSLISAYGLREGIIYESLSSSLKAQDSLLSASREMAHRLAKDPEYGEELIAWTENLFEGLQMSSRKAESIERLRQATCILGDIAWSQHLDFRGLLAAETALHAPFTAISHAGRCFIANALLYRHGMDGVAKRPRGFLSMKKQAAHLSKVLGLSLRLAHALSGSISGMIIKTSLNKEGDRLVLTLPSQYQDLQGKQVNKYLKNLSQLIDLAPEIRIKD